MVRHDARGWGRARRLDRPAPGSQLGYEDPERASKSPKRAVLQQMELVTKQIALRLRGGECDLEVFKTFPQSILIEI